MFSTSEKRIIAEGLQQILRQTGNSELPEGEIQFQLHVEGMDPEANWADIVNNGAVPNTKLSLIEFLLKEFNVPDGVPIMEYLIKNIDPMSISDVHELLVKYDDYRDEKEELWKQKT